MAMAIGVCVIGKSAEKEFKNSNCMCEKGVDILIGRPAKLALAMGGICPKHVDRQIDRARNRDF